MCNTYFSPIVGKRLKKIVYNEGEVEFKPGKERCDLLGDYVLDEIIVKDKNSNSAKKFQFNYGYLSGTYII